MAGHSRGLALSGTFTGSPPLHMAALAFTAYGVHWLSVAWIRLRRADARANIGMTVAFLAISVPERALGFFHLGTGLWLIYLVFAVALNFILKYTPPLSGTRRGASSSLQGVHADGPARRGIAQEDLSHPAGSQPGAQPVRPHTPGIPGRQWFHDPPLPPRPEDSGCLNTWRSAVEFTACTDRAQRDQRWPSRREIRRPGSGREVSG